MSPGGRTQRSQKLAYLTPEVQSEPDSGEGHPGVGLVILISAVRQGRQDLPLPALRVRVQPNPVRSVYEFHLKRNNSEMDEVRTLN